MSVDASDATPAFRVVVIGVAGSGKSTVGAALAAHLGARYVEADDHHLPSSIDKMRAGIPLDDDDRWPWLLRLRRELSTASPAAPVVVSCSALRRSYRDLLRRAGGVRFVFLDVSKDDVLGRVGGRDGHFMGVGMVESQFAALERPGSDEHDVAIIDASPQSDDVVLAASVALGATQPGPIEPLLVDGSRDRVITGAELNAHVDALAQEHVLRAGLQRVLLVPPDHTRLHSRAGEITALLYQRLTAAGVVVGVLPALGTHVAMSPADSKVLFGDAIPYEALLHHRWRDGLVTLGEIGAAEVRELSQDRFDDPIPVAVDEELLNGWDLVISVGQVVPHEVIGLANFTKNIVIGLGGAPTVHRSHFLGATCGMEQIMGRTETPVRHAVDAAFDRFIAPQVRVLWVLTVMEDTPDGVVQRGLFAGAGRSSESGGAAYRFAASLAVTCNVDIVDRPFDRVACWLDPNEFRSTWLGNKAIYRTRMAIADGGELIVLAPGVAHFGEDPAIDDLIRRHGYRGTPATLQAVVEDPQLGASLGAAAHLIHGSSEGRFRIVYCTDPISGGLTQAQVESVGFEWRPLVDECARLGVDATTPAGVRADTNGRTFDYIANPALGLWATGSRFESSGDRV
jgi:carbohydrate kinase (thermoresistant glucokinase family)